MRVIKNLSLRPPCGENQFSDMLNEKSVYILNKEILLIPFIVAFPYPRGLRVKYFRSVFPLLQNPLL